MHERSLSARKSKTVCDGEVAVGRGEMDPKPPVRQTFDRAAL